MGFLLLAVAFAAVVGDGVSHHDNSSLALVTKVTRLPGVAFSVSYFEPRVREYGDYSQTFFPGMLPINYLDFVYAQ